MTPDAPAADTGFLTIDQAVSNMDAAEKEQETAPAEAEAAPEPKPDTEAAPTADDAIEPDTATDGENAETDDAEEEAETPDLPDINPPPFWDAAAKERFRELPRDLQEIVLAKEAERDKATATAMQKSAEARKTADAEASRIAQVAGVLDKLLPQAVQTLTSRWEGVDWNKVVDEHGAEAAMKLRNDFEREQAVVQQLTIAKADADRLQHAKFVETETVKLAEIVPDLVDAKLGPQRRADLGKFLVSNNIPVSAIPHMTAIEASIAYDAMRWRHAQADASAKAASPKPVPKPAALVKPSVKPTAAAVQRNPQSQRLNTLSRKSVLTTEEAIELLNLREPAQ